jgi:hypothetical protein
VILLALPLGALAAWVLRRSGLHWSWALALIALAMLSGPFFPAPRPPLAVAGLLATLRGWHWHRRDLEVGGDLGLLARSRLAPPTVLRLLASGLTRRRRRRRPRTRVRDGELLLGRERDGRAVRVPFGEGSVGHALIVGATGSGKTHTQALIAARAVQSGLAVIAIDPKGDRAMRDRLSRAARSAGRGLIEWTPAGPSVYNPYARGSETEIVDRVLAGERFTEPHYLRQAQRYLGHAVRAIRAGREEEVSLGLLARLMHPELLEQALRKLPEDRARESHAYLDSLTTRQRQDLAGVRDRLAILVESDVGRWLEPRAAAEGQARLEMLAAIRSREVVYLNLEADRRPLLARMLGAAIVQDLQSAVASLQRRPAAGLVVIDEFSAVAAEQVLALFARARSAGIGLLLGTQELSDLRTLADGRLLERVLGNLSLLIAHRQVVPGSVELLVRLGGTRGAWRTSWSSTGTSVRAREREPRLDPRELTELPPGWAVVIPLGAGGEPRVTRISPGEAAI